MSCWWSLFLPGPQPLPASRSDLGSWTLVGELALGEDKDRETEGVQKASHQLWCLYFSKGIPSHFTSAL